MFKYPFSLDGRISRLEFGISILIYYVVSFPLGFIIMFIKDRLEVDPLAMMSLVIAVYLPRLWFLLAQGAKRCHDLNTSGWFQLIPFYCLWMVFTEGGWGENRYGPDPKGRPADYTDPNNLSRSETF